LLEDKLLLYTISEISSSSVDTGGHPPLSPRAHSDRPCRYAFRSEEKVALQEIGPRFTLKLRWLKKNIPAVYNYGESAAPLIIEKDEGEDDPVEGSENKEEGEEGKQPKERPKTVPPKVDEFLWQWKVCCRGLFALIQLTSFLAGFGDVKEDFLPIDYLERLYHYCGRLLSVLYSRIPTKLLESIL
jgi:hypothetical protein